MSATKKLFIILGAVMLTFFTSCDNNLFKKNGEITLDFSSLYNKGNTNSRNAIDDIIEGGKDCFVDLALEGTFTFSDTFNLKEQTSYTISDIPIGAQVKANVEVYTFENPDDPKTKEVIYSGQSRNYVITAGTTQIVVHLNKPKTNIEIDDPNGGNGGGNNGQGGNGGGGNQQQEDPKITIWVTYDENHQNNFWNDAENKSNEDPTKDGKTKDTGFYYIQSAVNWIAANGNRSENYEIMLAGTDETHIFDQAVYSNPSHSNTATVIFGETEGDADNLNYHAKKITLTSENRAYPAINASHSPCILFRSSGNVPVYFENIKISTNNRAEIIRTTYGISSDIYLGNGTVFSDNSESESSGSYAISINYGTITMQGNSKIEKFYGNYGGAVSIDYGEFIMEGNSRIENCRAYSEGGAIFITRTTSRHGFTMRENATIYKCTANQDGGAISMYYGFTTIESGSILECKANSQGGAIYIYSTDRNVSCEIQGGTIKDNEAPSGAAVYLQQGKNSQYISFIMSDNACIDLNNDICSYYTPIKLNSTLTTSKEKAALITCASQAAGESVITTGYNGSQQDIQNSYTKFYARRSNSDDDYYIDENGDLRKFDTENDFATDAVQIGDIVFADNKRVHADQLLKLSKRLRDSIAGIVFYNGGEMGERNLIAGTKTYRAEMDTTVHNTTSSGENFTMFNSTCSISNFPEGRRSGAYQDGRDYSYVLIDEAELVCSTYAGNSALGSTHLEIVKGIMQTIGNNSTSAYALYQKVFAHGKNFEENSNYTLKTADDKVSDNWYIPNIAELKFLYDAIKDSSFSNVYTTICGPLNNYYDYYSETTVNITLSPDLYRTSRNNSTFYYPYYYTLRFDQGKILCAPSNEELNAIPVHVYTP